MSAALDSRHYRVSGLRVRSVFALPELCAARRSDKGRLPEMEFSVERGTPSKRRHKLLLRQKNDDGSTWLECSRSGSALRFDFPGLAAFDVNASLTQVRCVASESIPAETVRHLFLDQVVPMLLAHMGREVLHASAVSTPGGASAFAGTSQSGKSTLAAAFQVSGYPALCDDCLLLGWNDAGRPTVEPSYPGLRLWDDSVAALFDGSPVLPAVSHYSAKRRVPAAARRGARAEPLRAIYLPSWQASGRRRAPGIERLSLRDALMALIKSSFRVDAGDRKRAVRQMDALERLVRQVPVKRLVLARDFSRLAEARDAVLEDLSRP